MPVSTWNWREDKGTELRKLIAKGDHKEVIKLIYEIATKYATRVVGMCPSEHDNDFKQLSLLTDREWELDDEFLRVEMETDWDELVDNRLYDLYEACDKFRVFLML